MLFLFATPLRSFDVLVLSEEWTLFSPQTRIVVYKQFCIAQWFLKQGVFRKE